MKYCKGDTIIQDILIKKGPTVDSFFKRVKLDNRRNY